MYRLPFRRLSSPLSPRLGNIRTLCPRGIKNIRRRNRFILGHIRPLFDSNISSRLLGSLMMMRSRSSRSRPRRSLPTRRFPFLFRNLSPFIHVTRSNVENIHFGSGNRLILSKKFIQIDFLLNLFFLLSKS